MNTSLTRVAYNRIKYDMTRVFVAMVYGTGTKREKKRKVEKSPVERDLSLMVSSDLKWTIQEEKATKSAKAFLAQTRNSFRYLDEELVRLLYVSLVMPHLEFAVPVWNPYPYRKKDNNGPASRNLRNLRIYVHQGLSFFLIGLFLFGTNYH